MIVVDNGLDFSVLIGVWKIHSYHHLCLFFGYGIFFLQLSSIFLSRRSYWEAC